MRDVEKLKEVFSNCGVRCNKETKGQIIDSLYEKSCKGEIGGGVDVADILSRVSSTKIQIPSEVDGTKSESLFLTKGATNYKIRLVGSGDVDLIIDEEILLVGNRGTLVEKKVTGSGSYTYKVDFTMASATQITLTVTTTAFSYNAGSVVIYYVEK